MMNDRDDVLFAKIVAAPDDDEPRLVWADAIGGERGELVVLQCALSNRGVDRAKPLSIEDRRRYVRREREILEKNAKTWSENEGAPGGTFVRGFLGHVNIEGSEFAARAPALAKNAPLVDHIELAISGGVSAFAGPTAREEWETRAQQMRTGFGAFPAGRIKSLTTDPTIWTDGDWASRPAYDTYGDALCDLLSEIPATRELRQLQLWGGAPKLSSISPFAESLEAFYVPMKLESPSHWIAILDTLPNVCRFRRFDMEALRGEFLSALFRHQGFIDRCVEELEVAPVESDDFALIGQAECLADVDTLRLHLGGSPQIPDVRLLCDSVHLAKNLRYLTLSGHVDDYILEAISEAPFARQLRTLNLRYINLRARVADILIARFPALEVLQITGTGDLLRREADLKDVIPAVE